MKQILSLILIFIYLNVQATNYYFSQSTGDDTRTAAQAQNPATPWKSLTKFNSYFSSFASGDSALFQRGDVFYGSVTATKSNVYVGAYGTGNAPIWTGLSLVSAWDAPVSNIYTSTAAASTLSTCQILVVNNANTAAGREPETGYWTIATTNGSTTITDGNISTSIVSANNGSQAVIRELMYEINRRTITNVSGTTITFSAGNPATGWGFFLQNDVKLCDNQNEWAYNTSTKKLAIYSTSLPTSVYIPTIETGFDLQGYSNIKIEGINFRGYNSYGVNLNSAVRSQSNVTITNSQFNFIGSDGIYGYPNSGNLTVTSNTFSECNNKGVNAASSDAATISYNSFNNIGNIAGMGQNGDDSYTGIVANGDNSTVSFNSITNAGYCGIRGDGNSTVVTRNYVKNTTYIKDDGGAIYFFSVQAGNVPFPQTTRTVSYNTVIDFPGAPAGSGVSGYKPQGAGLYFDGQSANINVTGNVVGNTNSVTTGNYGIFQNGGRNINTNGNTVYNCRQAMYVTKVSNGGGSLNNTTIVNNIFCSPTTVTDCDTKNKAGEFLFDSTANPIAYNASNNVYANPLNTNSTIYGRYSSGQCYTLAQWQTATGVESGSTTSPTTVSDTTKILFLTNPTSGAVTTSLGVSCIDLRNNAYAGTITLQPYTGAILLKTGTANTAPNCTAIPSATITLPVNSVSLNGVATSTTGGSIVSWSWVKTSGGAATITNASAQNTTVTGLVQGSYVFTLTATDNNGLTCTATKSITVNAAVPSIPPTVNAGVNQTIQLPTNSVTVTATAVASSGSITGYSWVKVSGGAATITSATSASTTITGLVAGTYLFSVTATQTNGLTATDTMQVIVSPANALPATGIKYFQASFWKTQKQVVGGWTSTITDNTLYFQFQKKSRNGSWGNVGANIIPKIGVVDYWGYDFSPSYGKTTGYRVKVFDKTGITYSEVVNVYVPPKRTSTSIGGNIILE